jgi:hypothetical protein
MNGFWDGQDQLNQSVHASRGTPPWWIVNGGWRGCVESPHVPRTARLGQARVRQVTIVWWAQVGVLVAADELVAGVARCPRVAESGAAGEQVAVGAGVHRGRGAGGELPGVRPAWAGVGMRAAQDARQRRCEGVDMRP